MTHGQSVCGERCDTPPPEVVTALNNLYIVSSALAQRGTYAQEIRDSQWRTMAQRVQEGKTALDQHGERTETQAIVLLRQMTNVCQGLIDLYSARREIPFAVWREVGRLGRDAYEWASLTASHRRGANA